MGKKGFFLSTTVAVVLAIVVVVLLVAEGLLIGFLAVPSCSDSPVTEATPQKTTQVVPTETQPTTPPGPDGPWTNSRLPEHLKPVYYDVTLRPVLEELEGTYWFYGSSSVQYQCMNATNYVIIHSRTLIYPDLWSDYLTVRDMDDGSDVTIEDVFAYAPNAYIVVEMASPCVVGKMYEMIFSEFRGELGDDLEGLYRSEYVNETGARRVIATTQMQVEGARQTFPCFDEPAFKANFTIRLRYRSADGYSALSCMPPISSQVVNIEGIDWDETTFDVTPMMPTYLLAMIVSDFTYEESYTSDNGTQTFIYARSGPINSGEAEYAAQVTPAILEYLEDFYSVPYLLPKSDQVAVSDFDAGAMENWGLVIYREVYLLFNPAVSSVYDKYNVAHIVAHELAHQWFGNLVTCAWWSDLWLNEGFASYVEYIAVEGVHPEWKQDELFVSSDLQSALSSDAYSTSHPLHHDEGYFSTITYSKGACILRMINGFLGEPTFTNALTKYLNNFEYRVADYNDLFRYWIAEADSDGLTFPVPLQNILETWVLQMGYPLIKLSRQGGNIVATQEYFLIDEDDTAVSTPGSDEYGYQWYVPIFYKPGSALGSSGAASAVWMNIKSTAQIPLDAAESFVVVNFNAVGFYRVAYEADMWTAIINKLTSSEFTEIPPQNRAQFIDDIFAVTRSGRAADATIEAAFDITRYLNQELDYAPWDIFLDNMVFYDRLLAGSNIFGDLSGYIVNLLDQSIYSFYGWEDSNMDDAVQVERMTRGKAIEGACHYGLPDCIDRAVELYRHWMENPNNNTISPTYRDEAYCTAIKAGGVEEWDFAWSQYLNADSAQEQRNLRYGMSCTKDSWLLNRYIEYCLDNTLVRNQDVSTTLGYISRHEHSKYVAWSFAVNNWDLMMNTVGSGATSNMLSYARRRFSTDFDLGLIDSLRPIAGSNWEATLNSYYNSVLDNMEWRNAVEDRIGAWLKGTPLAAENRPSKSHAYSKFINVDPSVIAEDRNFLKKF